MTNMTNWTKEIPKEAGEYWFYGDPFSNNPRPQDIKLHYVEIKVNGANYPFYIASGHFMDNKAGYWMESNLPEIPKEEN